MQERLLGAIRSGRAPHAILITGPEGSGTRELALRCAALYCLGEDAPDRLAGCPNYYEIGDGAVKVEEIRALLAASAMQGFNGGRRAFVFFSAQNLSVQIQNTLLKTLEEPHGDTLMILTGNEFGLLPTIRSRCMTERLGACSEADAARALMHEGMGPEEAAFYAALAEGIPNRARAYAEPEARTFREKSLRILEQAAFAYAPFADAAELVTVLSAEAENDALPDEEPKGKGARKRKKGDLNLALQMTAIFAAVFTDALNQSIDAAKPRNIDQAALIERIASCFTTAQIQGIIEMLASAQQKLSAGASVFQTLDGVLAGLYTDQQPKR